MRMRYESGVAPFAGAWIETSDDALPSQAAGDVAPFAGAWIETSTLRVSLQAVHGSPPSRGRGSKRLTSVATDLAPSVAPFAGAWIETTAQLDADECGRRRPLRGGVDRNA